MADQNRPMKMNTDLHAHYRQLLGLSEGWKVVEVNLDLVAKQVVLRLEWEAGRHGPCSKCETSAGVYDHLEERTWQHLNTMQFKTVIQARVPRIDCKQDGVTAIKDWLKACSAVEIVLPPGVFITTMPFLLAAATSISERTSSRWG